MFFQVDDQFQVNSKAITLARAAMTGDTAGLAALGVWTLMGSHCQAALTDGVVPFVEIVAKTLNAAIAQQLADRLVAAGLWHAPGHTCERCPAVAADTFRFHDWFALGYDQGADVRVKRDKSKELKNRALVNAVWARDCLDPANPNVGACRYCAKQLNKKDTRGADGPEMDHVDPNKAAGVRNVVLACGSCNRKKAGKTPEAAGMALQPAPAHSRSVEPVEAVSPDNADAEIAPGTTVNDVVSAALQPMTQQAPADLAKLTSAPTSAPTSAETSAGPAPGTVPKSILVCAGDRAGAGRAGQGGDGLRTGSGGVASAAPNKTRRRRGKGKPNPRATSTTTKQEQPPAQQSNPHDAGEAPPVPTPAQFGSAWHNWSGPPSDVTETTCTIHQLEQPCRKCENAND